MSNTHLVNIMKTELITIQSHEDLETACDLLEKNRIRHVPVVDSQGQVVGILSDRDLLRASIPQIDGAGKPVSGPLRFLSGSTAGQFMTSTLQGLPVNASIEEAIVLMQRNGISSCLVVDEDAVVGIITREDLLELFRESVSAQPRNLRTSIAAYVSRSPLGTISQFLSNVGI